jgi:hypothetical protein
MTLSVESDTKGGYDEEGSYDSSVYFDLGILH